MRPEACSVAKLLALAYRADHSLSASTTKLGKSAYAADEASRQGASFASRMRISRVYCRRKVIAFSALTLLFGHLACKKLSGGMLAWLSGMDEVQTCIYPSRCHCHSQPLAPVNPDTFLVLPFWYLLTRVVPDIFQKSSKTVVCVSPKGVYYLFFCISIFYRAMHFSAKCGIAIMCHLSVCLSVCDVGGS